jgi:tRNA(fMet)-specific endonuclease VapC
VFLLDSDIVSLLMRRSGEYPQLVRRVRMTSPDELGITAITVEERLRGTLDSIRKVQQRPEVVERYAFFLRVFHKLHEFNIVPYDEAADGIFHRFSPEVRRVGTQDCRIAAIALAGGHVVITRNVGDFAKIPGVRFEDWTISG